MDESVLAAIETNGVPEGVIHVVCNGLCETRSPVVREALLRERPTLAEYQALCKELEVDDLKQTLKLLEELQHQHRKPCWMIVAVTKCDLFANQLEDVRRDYDPDTSGEFVSVLREFSRHVGTKYFRWVSLPVCSVLESFTWGSEYLNPQLSADQRDAMLVQFARKLGDY